MRGAAVLFVILIMAPLVHSLSISELVSRYIFSSATPQMNITSYSDFMVDRNNNGINDTLVFELTALNAKGSFIFVINLFDRDGTTTNQTNKTLDAGINKINITFGSTLLAQNQLNYSIKVYNSSRSLKYRKDNIKTQVYRNYEEGFKIIKIADYKEDKTLKINATANSPINGTHVTTLFLSYNKSTIFIKQSKKIAKSVNNLIFIFDGETIKRTHFIGNFTVSSLKIGVKSMKAGFATSFYDFRDFASSSYISGFTDSAIDADSNGKYDFLRLDADAEILEEGNYTVVVDLRDLFGNVAEIKNISSYLPSGKNKMRIDINGSVFYGKKLNGPFAVKSAKLFENGTLVDNIDDAYTTSNYNFNDFEKPDLPDIKTGISVSDGYHYGIENLTVNFTFKNTGKKHAFSVFTEIFDNRTFSRKNMSNVLYANSEITYEFNFTNISDFEASAIADLQDFIEESNESNNAEKKVIKLNRKPVMSPIINITVKETGRVLINLSASDPDGDGIFYSINLSKFSHDSNIFEWNTTTLDSGEYALEAAASDGFLNDSLEFRITVLDAPEIDFDNDGIDDGIDALIGDENSVNTSTINLGILLDGSRNLSRFLNERKKLKFTDGNLTIAEFDFDFSRLKLNLSKFKINKQSGNFTGSLVFRGLQLPHGLTKTLYVDRVNSALNGICIKDGEIESINEISGSCSRVNETKVECDGTLQGSYICSYNSTINKYKIEGLRHSGVVQIDYARQEPQPSASSNSGASSFANNDGGGSDLTCISSWECDEWAQCKDGLRKRKCRDMSHCTFPNSKPSKSQECGENQKSPSAESSLNPAPVPSVSHVNFEDLKEISNGLQSITGKTIDRITDSKLSYAVITLMGVVFLAGGYFVIVKYQGKIN